MLNFRSDINHEDKRLAKFLLSAETDDSIAEFLDSWGIGPEELSLFYSQLVEPS